MPCIRVYRMLHTMNPSSLLLRPLAIETLVIEAHITVPKASTYRPLVISAAETLVIEAHVTVPNASASGPLITIADTLVIKAPITVAKAPAQMLPITVAEAPLHYRCNIHDVRNTHPMDVQSVYMLLHFMIYERYISCGHARNISP